MPFNKPHLEFHSVDLGSGWETPPGYPSGIQQKILASDIDEASGSGSRTRLLKFDPGTFTTEPFVHDHWEEVYLLQGDLIVGNGTGEIGGCMVHNPNYDFNDEILPVGASSWVELVRTVLPAA